MDKLKIGLFIDTYYPMIDGVIMVVDNYAKRLKDRAEVTVFCPKPKSKKYKDEFEYAVKRCKRVNFFWADYCVGVPKLDRKFRKELDKMQLDIVHIHSPFGLGKIGVKYARKHNVPVIATLHSQFKQDFYKATKMKWLTNILLKKTMKTFNDCDLCWAVNEGIGDLFVNDYGLTSPCGVQYNGTEMVTLDKDYTAEINEQYNIKPDQKVFLFVGRLTLLKNILFIVDSLSVLKQKGVDFKMLYVGSGGAEAELRNRIKKHNLEDDVILCGRVADRVHMAKIYQRADLFLFPSPYDTDGLVKYEAASQYTPTVSIKGFHCAGNIFDNENGFLSENSPEAYAEKIYEVLNDTETLEQVKQTAHDKLYRSWDDVVNYAYDDYKKIIAEKK